MTKTCSNKGIAEGDSITIDGFAYQSKTSRVNFSDGMIGPKFPADKTIVRIREITRAPKRDGYVCVPVDNNETLKKFLEENSDDNKIYTWKKNIKKVHTPCVTI